MIFRKYGALFLKASKIFQVSLVVWKENIKTWLVPSDFCTLLWTLTRSKHTHMYLHVCFINVNTSSHKLIKFNERMAIHRVLLLIKTCATDIASFCIVVNTTIMQYVCDFIFLFWWNCKSRAIKKTQITPLIVFSVFNYCWGMKTHIIIRVQEKGFVGGRKYWKNKESSSAEARGQKPAI